MAILAVYVVDELDNWLSEAVDMKITGLLIFVAWAWCAGYGAWRLHHAAGRRWALWTLIVPAVLVGLAGLVQVFRGGAFTRPGTRHLVADILLLATYLLCALTLLYSARSTRGGFGDR